MWRPKSIGDVIAERRLLLSRRRKRRTTVIVKFGRPVRGSRADKRDPWWCPVQIRGLGPTRVRTVAGEDSLQALILALEFVAAVVPAEAERVDGQLEWLGERERLVFADTTARAIAYLALQNMADALADAIEALESRGR
jgi:hypothetical protein